MTCLQEFPVMGRTGESPWCRGEDGHAHEIREQQDGKFLYRVCRTCGKLCAVYFQEER